MTPKDPEIGRSVQADGLQTNYLEQGEGEPVVLIHGSGPGVTAYANWRLVMPELARHYRVLAPDIAGFGYTERKADPDYTLDGWVRHLVAWMDAVGVPRARIVGNSFGGALALAIAARHPERVERLVLMGSVGVDFELTPGLDAVWGYEPSEDNMRRIVKLFAHDSRILSEELVRSRFQASMRPGYQASFSRMFAAPRQRHIAALATPEEAIRRITQPALVVHGRDDQVIPVSNAWKLNALLPNSDLHVFGNCGHWTQIERKDDFCRLVLDFFADAR
ncbi:alpha/beta fold hydrolase [Ramlibacter rhizophilus]|uniref:Alpha/beta fold hydrolase n=1 Tax=Ramlibacter rhizophilus TaxID=1781167 RepID=A0A4Z0BH55_9BURK|nr:alpha/beta fold hydrolase [Ramlibacter rhizophilus]TFY98632.1 alpha/beta fold hydrolase [Ramlibacter rhizophilus]